MRFLSRRPREIEETEMTPRLETVALAAGQCVARRRALRFKPLGAGPLSARQMAETWSLWRRDRAAGAVHAGVLASSDAGDDPMLWRRAQEPDAERLDRDRSSEPSSAWFARLWGGSRD